MAVYNSLSISNILGNKLMLHELIREGIPYSLFNVISKLAPFNIDVWANLLNVSTKSLQRYKESNATFKPIHSEKIIEMAEVTSRGISVFGDVEKFNDWLNTPSFALGGKQPFDLLGNSYGKDLVMAELSAIDHGIFS